MMEYPLTLAFILRRAETLFGHKAIITRRPDKTIHRYTYADFVPRAKKLAVALRQLGLRRGDRVATLCWNQYEHVEAYFGVPLAGMVLHTINPRLHPSDLAYIVNDAEDRVLIVDDSLLPLLEKFRADVRIEHIVVVEHGAKAPAGTIGYEKLLAGADANAFAYPELDEREAAAMCYTSGTTGRPKGVVYSHRAIVLHSLGQASGAVGVLESDVVLPVVPMFHVNAWGLPFTCTMVGATQVHPGPHLDAESLCELFVGEHVTYTAGVPTIWLGLLRRLDERPKDYDLSQLRLLVVGGSAAPTSRSRIAPRTSSSPGANGSARSRSRTRSWVTPRSPKPRSSRSRTRAGRSVPSRSSCSSPGRWRLRTSSARSSRPASRNGGCPTRSSSSPRYQRARRASSARLRSASASRPRGSPHL